jgi:tetratricopeptide (TPR) repeat protein
MVDDVLAIVGLWGGDIVSAALSGCTGPAWLDLPGLSISTGDPPELVEVYEKACAAIEENPNDAQAHFVRGVVCQGKCWYEAALADFAVVLRLEPRHARAWLLASEVLSALGKYEQAQTARQKALEIDPQVG